MAKADAPKVKNPHPLMQQGTPSIDIESDHIAMFTVSRAGTGGPPKYVTTLQNPAQILDPSAVRAVVGGGDYLVRALANAATSGKRQGEVLGAVTFGFDGPPIIKAEPVPAATLPVTPASIVEQASSQLPTLMTAAGTMATAVLGFLTESRNARAEEERRRREYEDAKVARDKDERDRRDAKERAEAEERRAREQREAEERRAEREQREQERREQERRRDDERLQAQREEAQARAAREAALLQQLLNRPDPNAAMMQLLLQKALNPPAVAPPAPVGPTTDQIIDTAQKLKALTEDGPEKIIAAMMPLAQTIPGQVMLARIGAIAGLCPPPDQMGLVPAQAPQQQPVVPPEPAPVPQIPEQATPAEAPTQEFAPGPVTMN